MNELNFKAFMLWCSFFWRYTLITFLSSILFICFLGMFSKVRVIMETNVGSDVLLMVIVIFVSVAQAISQVLAFRWMLKKNILMTK